MKNILFLKIKFKKEFENLKIQNDNLNNLNLHKEDTIRNLKHKFEDLFKRHENALNNISELTEKIKLLEIITKKEKNNLYPSNNGVNLGNLMMSENEISENITTHDHSPEKFTINMKLNIKKFNHYPSIRPSNTQGGVQHTSPGEINKRQDILVISEEIYQKRISKV